MELGTQAPTFITELLVRVQADSTPEALELAQNRLDNIIEESAVSITAAYYEVSDYREAARPDGIGTIGEYLIRFHSELPDQN